MHFVTFLVHFGVQKTILVHFGVKKTIFGESTGGTNSIKEKHRKTEGEKKGNGKKADGDKDKKNGRPGKRRGRKRGGVMIANSHPTIWV